MASGCTNVQGYSAGADTTWALTGFWVLDDVTHELIEVARIPHDVVPPLGAPEVAVPLAFFIELCSGEVLDALDEVFE
jgi:hypothetical protein